MGVGSALRQALEVEDPPSPLPPSGLRLQVVSGTRRLSGDIRPAEGQSWTWDLAVSRAGAGPVTMSWPRLLRQVPRGLVVELADLATGRAMVLNTCSSYAFTAAAGEERRLRLTARLGHVERSEITGFTVTANRAGGSSVALTLSAPADVRVMVRGLGGSLVRELSRRAATAGTTSLVWDGLDSVGRRVPRGVYVLEAVAVAANGAATRATRTLLVR